MKIKVKHILLFILTSIIIFTIIIYNIVINKNIYEEVNNRNIVNNKLISLMLEETRGSGIYKLSKIISGHQKNIYLMKLYLIVKMEVP